jgi:hypothetical protein
VSLLNVLGAGETVTREFNGLRIDAPKNWDDRSTVVLRSPDRQGQFRVNLVMTRAKVSKPLDALVAELRGELEADPSAGLELGDSRELSVDGTDAVVFDLRQEVPLSEDGKDKIAVVRRHLMVVKKGTLYNLIFTDIAEFFDSHKSTIEAMFGSVRLPS